jgi:hypothetical protein
MKFTLACLMLLCQTILSYGELVPRETAPTNNLDATAAVVTVSQHHRYRLHLAVVTSSLPSATAGTAYSATLQATGGVTPYRWSITGLPSGLSLNTSTGLISGTPISAGTYSVTVSVSDSSGVTQTATNALTLTVAAATSAPLAIATSSLASATAGTTYTATLQATGGMAPYSWSASGLPGGLSVNASNGVISGTPSATGTFTVTAAVRDSESTAVTASKALNLTVSGGATTAPLAIATSSLASATVGTTYAATLQATGGVTPYTWSASGLPSGLSLNASTGAISGTPSASGTSTITVSVKDSSTTPATATHSFALTVAAATSSGTIIVNHDLSTSNLMQWTHRDWGMGTDVGSNNSGAGYLWYHDNVGGRRAAGMTATPTAQASPAASSDSVYLWDPTEAWNYSGQEVWVRTSFMFPSQTTISASGSYGEAPYQPTTGDWNWFLELHNDSNPVPSCAQEYANLSFDVVTDDPVVSGNVGTQNVRIAARLMGGNDCSPNTLWINGPALQKDHWYEFLLHIKWSPTAGIFEWYVDGHQYYSNLNTPTLYTRPAGYVSPSYTSLTTGNYRWHAPWNSTIYMGPLAVGSTQGAVQNAF